MTILHTHDINDGGDEIRRAADKSQLFHLVEQVAPLLALDTPHFFKGRDRERTLAGARIDTDASHHLRLVTDGHSVEDVQIVHEVKPSFCCPHKECNCIR